MIFVSGPSRQPTRASRPHARGRASGYVIRTGFLHLEIAARSGWNKRGFRQKWIVTSFFRSRQLHKAILLEKLQSLHLECAYDPGTWIPCGEVRYRIEKTERLDHPCNEIYT